MVYVKRRDTFHVDSSPDLYGEVKALVLRCQLDCIMLNVITPALSIVFSASSLNVNSLHHCLMLWLLLFALSDALQLLRGPL